MLLYIFVQFFDYCIDYFIDRKKLSVYTFNLCKKNQPIQQKMKKNA